MCRYYEIQKMYVGARVLQLLKQDGINLTEKIYHALNNLLDFFYKKIAEKFSDKKLYSDIYSELKKRL